MDLKYALSSRKKAFCHTIPSSNNFSCSRSNLIKQKQQLLAVVEGLGGDELGVDLSEDFQASEQALVELVAVLWDEPEIVKANVTKPIELSWQNSLNSVKLCEL